MHPSPPSASLHLLVTLLLPAYALRTCQGITWYGLWPAEWCCPQILLCQNFTQNIIFWFVIIFFLYFSACVDRAIQLPSTTIPALCCALSYSVGLPCVSLSPCSPYLPHPQTCTWLNLLLGVCTGIRARSCVAWAGRSISVTILQIRIVLSRQGLVCPLSLDLPKLVLSFQPAFSEVAHTCEFRHTVKRCLVSCGDNCFSRWAVPMGVLPFISGQDCGVSDTTDLTCCDVLKT